MKVLISGLGSIAKKHISAMHQIDETLEVYALRSRKDNPKVNNITNLNSLDELKAPVDFCIISNPTALHYSAIEKLIPLNVPLFIEKPSLMSLDNSEALLKKINYGKIKTYVGFCLRFHPIIKFLKEYLQGRRIIEVNIYCGSYLPSWRQGVDYRDVYSAREELGGGVQYDLSHEIDYALWLFGIPDQVEKTRLRLSDLEINSCDFAGYRLIYKNKVVNIALNYFRRKPKRTIEIVFRDDTLLGDLIQSTVQSESLGLLFSPKVEISNLYIEQMTHFYNIVRGNEKSINSLEESLTVIDIL